MPIQLEIFHPDRIVIAVARGHVTLEDYGGLLAEIVKADVTHYRKIIDSTDAESDAVTLDLLLKADELTRSASRTRGPLALVVNRAKGEIARGFQEGPADRGVHQPPRGARLAEHTADQGWMTIPVKT